MKVDTSIGGYRIIATFDLGDSTTIHKGGIVVEKREGNWPSSKRILVGDIIYASTLGVDADGIINVTHKSL